MASKFYEKYLKQKHWRDLRKVKIWASNYACEKCGSGENLEVHHLTYVRIKRELLEDLQVLCGPCHAEEHGISFWREGENLKMVRNPKRKKNPNRYKLNAEQIKSRARRQTQLQNMRRIAGLKRERLQKIMDDRKNGIFL